MAAGDMPEQRCGTLAEAVDFLHGLLQQQAQEPSGDACALERRASTPTAPLGDQYRCNHFHGDLSHPGAHVSPAVHRVVSHGSLQRCDDEVRLRARQGGLSLGDLFMASHATNAAVAVEARGTAETHPPEGEHRVLPRLGVLNLLAAWQSIPPHLTVQRGEEVASMGEVGRGGQCGEAEHVSPSCEERLARVLQSGNVGVDALAAKLRLEPDARELP
mmetsp:Transcript_35670/g.98349  ORF Transcript_35670/g.98349 Transcript_35670/m.98349 type:complete len:217 (-) Transcript_35670:114-764(-)